MKRILILSANPKNTTPLRLDEEIREIKEGLRRATQRDNFVIETGQAVRYRDIRRAILDFGPNIVHFSGHGAGEEGLAFEDETGQVKLVEAQALAGLFGLFADQIECVVLNACYSEVQAKAIAEHISYVVGMRKAIGDKAAIEFAVGFYDALGAGRTVEFAYELGCNSIEIAGISEHLTPQLLSNSDILTNKVSSQAEVNPPGEPSTKYNQKQTTIDQLDKKKSDSVLEEVTQRPKASISHDNFINPNSLDFDNARLYLSIKLKKVSSQSNNSESEKFSVDTKVSIPQSPTDYQQENLLETFKENAPYTQTEIEENIPNLLEECYQKLEEIGFEQDVRLAIEWVFDDDLFSLNVDCWKFKEDECCSQPKRIGCASFASVHIRSYRRLRIKRCLSIWKRKWDWLTENANRMKINNYIFASQTNDKSDNALKAMDMESQQMIIGINLPTDLLRLENISYEFIIERGIPLALWSRCQNYAVNHPSDLDKLIKPKKDNEENLKDDEDNVLNLENLPKSVELKRLEATEGEPCHLGHHLCFLWENPYNYPISKKLKL
ncbi:MAG: CHAT domain-containing protein [Microcystis aeruginosa W13-11]|nr:CHAT domain-containing protein [Microcystis aeruginosa W13-11]